MELNDLLDLSIAELQIAIDSGEVSLELATEALAAEAEDKNRSGALEVLNDFISTFEAEAVEEYVIADNVSMRFQAGMKVAGDLIDADWPEYKDNEGLLAQHIELNLIVGK